MRESKIQIGVHYSALHENKIYSNNTLRLAESSLEGNTTVSIPYHEKLSKTEIERVIKGVGENAIRC